MAPHDDDSVKPIPSRRKRWFAVAAAACCAALAASVWAVATGRVEIPERFNPWAPLDVAAEPDWLTGFKLSRTRRDPVRCLSALAQTGMQYDLLTDRVTGPGCGFRNAVRLRSAGVRLGSTPSLSCPMALSFFMWERHALQPAAMQRFGQPVVAIDHVGSYACRNVNRGEGAVPGASRSRHATADALDVAGLTLASGRRITVLQSWPRDAATSVDDPAAMLLLDAHRGACRFFNGVLGPNYNAAHKDHFHLETGGYDMCL
ncbi:extensin [Variovorax sp. Root318D1]|uniref:extensin-like domain-containing protein n=1 Tax=Variovorax sp. Root318D1 TaxID=1736513 RepID=UPI0006FF6543|nr:extensin family protein [Variovorax sp. Root318D1]KQU85281.1 extensin [Variovorax sp. Root318D1]